MIIVLNHKSNLDKKEYIEYIKNFSTLESNHKLVICPSFINIGHTSINNMILGAQNVSSYNSGAHTGEVSASQLKSYDIEYVIVGHSERRKNQKESLSEIEQKIKQVLKNEMVPILCVGETQEERSSGKVETVIEEEIKTAISNLDSKQKEKIIVAYEPIWSIGTGLIPSNKEINKTITYIKKILPKNKVLYGGSVNEENIDIIKKISIIDGYLIGGLSLKIEKLKVLLKKIN